MTLTSTEAFSDITSVLAVGKADTHGGPTMKQLKEDYKFTVVLDLNDKKSEAPKALKYGLKYIGRKTSFAPTPAFLENLSKTIDQEVQHGERIYIHCHKGIYRAPTVAAAYLVYKGMTVDAAIKRVKSLRPSALPGIENSVKLVPLLRTFEEGVREKSK